MKIKGILLLVIQTIVVNLYAQNLSESLGGINTDFQFYSDTFDLKVTDQILIRRAEKSIGSALYSEAAAGWGYLFTPNPTVPNRSITSSPRNL